MIIRTAHVAAVFDHIEHAGALAVCIQCVLPSLFTPTVMIGAMIALICVHVVFTRGTV